MGSFNTTCQISQLPICVGDSVRFMLLTKNEYIMDNYVSPNYMIDQRKFEENCAASLKGESHVHKSIYLDKPRSNPSYNSNFGLERCYVGDFWFPNLVPIKAEYNDYGKVCGVDETSIQWRIWKSFLERSIVEEHNNLLSKELDFNSVQEASVTGILRFKPILAPNIVPVCQTMIHEDLYQELLSIESIDWGFGDPLTRIGLLGNAIKLVRDDCLTDKSVFVHNGKKYFNFSSDYENRFYTKLEHGLFDGLKHYRSWIFEEHNAGKLDLDSGEFMDFLAELTDFMYVGTIVDQLRKCWHPGSGMGSQSVNYNTYKKFNSKVNSAIAKSKKRNKYYK